MSLLPSGFYDVLAPDAESAAEVTETLMAHFAKWGYTRVAPPLAEFEESLLAGPGAAMSGTTFRVMDIVSHRMLGLRTDHTLQLGRIAATRLGSSPRPLRLSYAGDVLRAAASEREPARQKKQIGLELIGSLAPESDAEAICLGFEALEAAGITDAVVDISLPTLVTALLADAKLDEKAVAAIRHALDRKDIGALEQATQGSAIGAVLKDLLQAPHDSASALALLAKLKLPASAKTEETRLKAVLELLKPYAARLTVDLVESRYFEYQTGLSFSFFAREKQVELGRGGRYRTAAGEPATGMTFYSEALMQVRPAKQPAKRLLVSFHTPPAEAAKLHAQGYVLLPAYGDVTAEAARSQGCDGYWKDGKIDTGD